MLICTSHDRAPLAAARGPLACGADVGGAPADGEPGDRGAAARAGLTGAAVDLEAAGKVPGLDKLVTFMNDQSSHQSSGDSMMIRLAHGVRLCRTR